MRRARGEDLGGELKFMELFIAVNETADLLLITAVTVRCVLIAVQQIDQLLSSTRFKCYLAVFGGVEVA